MSEFSLEGESAKLLERKDVREVVVSVTPTYDLDENTIQRAKENSVKYFTSLGKLGAILGRVKPEEIAVIDKETVYRPYWEIAGTYGCRYLRKHSHKIGIEQNVEAVQIYGHEQQVVTKQVKLSDLLSKVGGSVTLGVGVVSLPLAPLEDIIRNRLSKVLSTRDFTLDRETELCVDDIIERVLLVYTARAVYDANLGKQDGAMTSSLGKVKEYEGVDIQTLKGSGKVIDALYSKERVIEDFKRQIAIPPKESPQRIIEQEYVVNEVKLIYVPFYILKLKRGLDVKEVEMNALTGITELKKA